MDDTFEALLCRYQSGEATSAEVTELERLLRADVDLRRVFADRFILDVHLYKFFVTKKHANEQSERKTSLVFRIVQVACATAAGILLAVGIGFYYPAQDAAKSNQSPLAKRNATPTADSADQNQGAAGTVVSGQVLVKGIASAVILHREKFEVPATGPVALRLSDGSRAEFAPSTQGILLGRVDDMRQVIEVSHGGGKFNVAHGGGQFRVDTPVGSVTALGTIFTAALQSSASSDPSQAENTALAVAVSEGRVEVAVRGHIYTLIAGQRRIFGPDMKQISEDEDDDEQEGNHENRNRKPDSGNPSSSKGNQRGQHDQNGQHGENHQN